MKNNHWYSVRNQSLAVYARNVGFDLAVYGEYSKGVQAELRKRAISEALNEIDSACEDQDVDIGSVKTGVYVISLSNPLAVRYSKKRSQVIYVGMGNIMPRIKSHFEASLFDFMQSLSGANFDFSFARPARKGPSANYYKHVEHLMLEYFASQFGSDDKNARFPLFNANAGSNKHYANGSDWWKKPLKSAGKRPLWEIAPTSHSDFETWD